VPRRKVIGKITKVAESAHYDLYFARRILYLSKAQFALLSYQNYPASFFTSSISLCWFPI